MLSDVKASDQCINVSFMVVMFVQRLRATWWRVYEFEVAEVVNNELWDGDLDSLCFT
jgi:hypothetical protein